MKSGMNGPSLMGQMNQLAELKRVAASVENAMSGGDSKQMVVTSPLPGEGKTMLSMGLAIQAASTYGHKVLAVDMHWRAPRLHAFFNLEQNYDESQMKDSDQLQTFVQKNVTLGVDVLAAPGGSNVDQSRQALKVALDFLKKVRSSYDRIVVDTGSIFPPNRFMLDPMNFAGQSDGVVMVIMGGVTPRDLAKKASLMFKNSGVKLIGVVMNQWKNPL